MTAPLKEQIQEAVKTAMRAKEKERLNVLRLIMAEIKQVEVDQRIEMDDAHVLSILDKMTKKRRESIELFSQAGRQALVDQEEFEISVIQSFLPPPLSEQEVTQLIQSAIAETQAASVRDMSKVMAWLKPHLQGRADIATVSVKIKQHLAG